MASTRIRVTVKYVEILDRKDLDAEGEFVFQFKGSTGATEQTTRIPEKGHLSISDHPSMNKVTLNTVVFEGEVSDEQTFVLEAGGEELDTFSANDQLNAYRREFHGPVSGYLGSHSPWDQGTDDVSDPEQLGDWRFAFMIEAV